MPYILRINLGSGQATKQNVPPEYKRLGGRGLTSTMVANEVPPYADPFGEKSKLVFAPGLLAGTNASSVNRLSLGGKSPLTGGIKESNSGGTFALKLARLGIKALVLEGLPDYEEFKIIKISKDDVEILDGEKYRNLNTIDTADVLRKDFGEKYSMAVIGPAGERKYLCASVVVTDKEGVAARHLGRGGLGAVMGSKKVKAILVDDSGCSAVKGKDSQLLRDSIKQYTKALRTTPQTSEIYTNYGTNAMVDTTNSLGGMPTKNFSVGTFEDAEKINGIALRERILERNGDPSHGCMPGCIIKSSNIYCDKEGNEVVRSIEYETVVLCGSNWGISDLDAIAEFNAIINKLGLDSIDIGVAIGIAMEAGLAKFGDIEGAKSLLKEIENDSTLGKLLGSGAAITGKVLGIERIPAAKGQAFPAYDPRSVKGHGVTFATSPMGADHTAGMNIREGLDPHSKEGQIESSKKVQLLAVIYDSLGLCLFAHVAVRDKINILTDMLSAIHGDEWKEEDLFTLAKNVLKLEIKFNRLAGLDIATDCIPEVFTREKLPPFQTTFDIEFDELQKVFD
jgi:aldehyde:ferredoxin oxidoreductase